MAGDRLELSAPARWSKYVTRWESAPSPLQPTHFVEWLLDFGRRSPGHVLYPTSDDLAWLFAEHAADLAQFYHLYQPSAASLLRLLDKRSLKMTCDELNIPTPPTLFPGSVEEALQGARQLGYPLLLKPRTQVLQRGGGKGHIVRNDAELRSFYDRLLVTAAHEPLIRQHIPGVHQPMLQGYREVAAERVYSISGFLGADGQVVVRAARKVLQRPRLVGVGICFESAPVEEEALNGVLRLCRTAGYYGVFEVEFLRHDQRLELIDFNPRFYGQLAFDIGRELPLPHLVWLAAQRRDAELGAEIARAQAFQGGDGLVYCNRFMFSLMLTMQSMSGRMSAAEVTRWREWLRRSHDGAKAVDPMYSSKDVAPGVVSAFRELARAFRHPRDFYRQVIVGSVLLALLDSDSLELMRALASLIG
jgi:predicted ATP-grasp superfamily ATP-dependent carboligase